MKYELWHCDEIPLMFFPSSLQYSLKELSHAILSYFGHVHNYH